MQRRTLLGAVGGATLLGGGAVAYELFAPEQATEANEDRTGSNDDEDAAASTTGENDGSTTEGTGSDGDGATVLKTGEFTGKDGHECSGSVELAEDADGVFLQFREYEQTQGPDVYCYLTPAPDPDTNSEIDAGTKVRIDGGADGGEMTKTGTFAQSLPDDVDVDAASGVGVWCDDFSVPFGAATLEDA